MTATTMIAPEPEQALTRVQSVNRRILLGAWRMPSFRIGFFIFVALLLVSAIYPELSSASATKMIVKDKFLSPLFLFLGLIAGIAMGVIATRAEWKRYF